MKIARTFHSKIQNHGKGRKMIEIPKEFRDKFSKNCTLKVTVKELE